MMTTFDIETHVNDIAITGKIIWGLINGSYDVTQAMQGIIGEAQRCPSYSTQSKFIQTELTQLYTIYILS